MKYVIIFFCLFLIININSKVFSQNINEAQSKYYEIFKEDYTEALNYFDKNMPLLNLTFNKHNIDKEIIIPVIFPERIRYSIIKNYLETKALEVIYVEYGSKYVDFSIGDFQLKPSFAEKIEHEITKNDKLKTKYSFLPINKLTKKEEREERVIRLTKISYQIHYISAFYDIITNRFDLSKKSKVEKIKFIASAYNFGFDKSKKEIQNHINAKFFPYGTKYPGNQYSYTNVAVDYYKNYIKPLN
ncbi:MAG: hypothetical protein L3J35_08205 [Bacteroidales bacterium]|nr:hypothetical protein [Bacteroidales bacterium]